MQTCSEQWLERISALHDGEIPRDERRAVERHLDGCAPCRAFRGALAGLGDDLRRASRPEEVGPELRERYRQALEGAGPGRVQPQRGRRLMMAWVAVLGAAVVLAVVGASRLWNSGMDPQILGDAVGHHLKAFSRATPCQFESSNSGEVARWLEQRLGYPVDVPDVSDAKLLGARSCQLGDVRVAAVLYRHGQDALTVYLPPPASDPAREAASFAQDGTRCAAGPFQEYVCISRRSRGPTLAVSSDESVALLGAGAR